MRRLTDADVGGLKFWLSNLLKSWIFLLVKKLMQCAAQRSYPRPIKTRQYGPSRKSSRSRDESRTTATAPLRRADRCRQYFATDRKRAFRRSGKIRRGQRSPYLWRLFQPAAQILDRNSPEVRHRSLSTICLHDR